MLNKQYVSMRLLPIIVAFTMVFGCMTFIQLSDSYADESNHPTTTLNVIGATENVDWLVLKTEPFNTEGDPYEAEFENYTLGTAIERTWKNADGLVPWFSTNKAELHEKCGIFTGISLSNDKGVTISAFYASDITKGLEKDELESYDYSPSLTTDGKPGPDNQDHEIYWYSGLYYDPDSNDYNFYQSRCHRPAKPWVEVFFADDLGLKREAITTENHIITLYFNGAERKLDLEESDIEVEAGQTIERVAKPQSSYYGDAEVTYTSSDESVATVDAAGVVTGVAAGEANITASIKNGDKETSKSYKVSVTKAADPAVDSLVEAINDLPDPDKLTLDDENTVYAAQDAYNALTPEQQAQVTNYNVLLEARLAIAQLKLDQAELDKKAAQDELQAIKDEIAASKLTVSGLKVTSKARKFTVTWKKNAKADGYQIQYRLKGAKKFKTLKETTKIKAKTKKLKKGKKYQFRVRTYKNVDGTKIYGVWTNVKTYKCK